jgi:hypothetical protein
MPDQNRQREIAEQIARLFAELGEVYVRASDGTRAPATTRAPLHVREEAAKASEIIRRIREMQGL